jgi:hypothetical protein
LFGLDTAVKPACRAIKGWLQKRSIEFAGIQAQTAIPRNRTGNQPDNERLD